MQDDETAYSFDGTTVPAQRNGICPRCGYVLPEVQAFHHNAAVGGVEQQDDIQSDKGIVDH
jgi:hypothetical protein